MKRVLLAMSGGVDSSVAAYLLKKQGYQVTGLFMKNYTPSKNCDDKTLCWINEKENALKVAALLNIPLIILDSEKEYRNKVIKPMFEDYEKNKTPNPDILCNKIIKFPQLLKKANQLKYDYIATGHYAKIKNNCLEIPKDKNKDQTYFLYHLKKSILKRLIFPLENQTKQETREIARKNKFPNYDKKSSSGVCFIGQIDFKKFLKNKLKTKKGNVLSPEKKIIGTHKGSKFFTIGERVKENEYISIDKEYRNKFKSKLFIAKKIKNDLIIAPKNHNILKKFRIKLKKIHWIEKNIPSNNIKARIRHLGKLYEGKLNKKEFIFKQPQQGIASGQSIVFYYKNKVLGGAEMLE
jgi:tRNA-specific 2-thiouridylase